ncbi:MAG: RluA family pseudouridine synthase [Rhodocyclales bacterium]|nr:RluA family pseudouridine synthase [Rhodocyclales bacterium]
MTRSNRTPTSPLRQKSSPAAGSARKKPKEIKRYESGEAVSTDLGSGLSVQQRVIDSEEAGQRLDNYLLRHLKGVPKSRIYKIVRSGEVRINKGRCQPDQRLNEGDVLRLPPVRCAAFSEDKPPVAPIIDLPVLYEDESLIALNKPCGVAVHGGSGLAWGLIEALRAQRPDARFLELAHRLDRETSGVLLVAKKRAALVALHDMFREQRGDKRYLALVPGVWAEKSVKVTLPLVKYLTAEGERRVRIAKGRDLQSPEVKPSETHFRLKKQYPGYALVEAKLKTGRTHQIRVHLAALGYPIVGDDKYGDFALNKSLASAKQLERMFLHAAMMRCKHPVTGEPLNVDAPLPPELESFLGLLERNNSL